MVLDIAARSLPALASLALAFATCAASAREHGTARSADTIIAIVVHTVGGPVCRQKRIWFEPIPERTDDARIWRDALLAAPVADAHFVIGRSGTVETVIPIDEIANHTVGSNAVSIGIELVHRGDGIELFRDAQVAAFGKLIKQLRHDHPAISLDNVVGHSDLDQRTCTCNGVAFHRRQDPGANFPWSKVVAAIRTPRDPPRGKSSLSPLVGAAPPEACPGS